MATGRPPAAPTPVSAGTPLAREVLRRAGAIPPGFVTTYGDLCPQAPRFAGAVMAAHGGEVAWQRVVRADGSLAKGERQRRLLEAEGVPFRGERVEMERAWVPVRSASPGTAAPRAGSSPR